MNRVVNIFTYDGVEMVKYSDGTVEALWVAEYYCRVI